MTSQESVAVVGKASAGITASLFGAILTTEYLTSVVASVIIIIGSLFFQLGKDGKITTKHLALGASALFMSIVALFYWIEYKSFIYIAEVFIVLLPDESIGMLRVLSKKVGLVK